jgi:hypothetical protein
LKKSTLSGTWTGDLPVCSIVPQPTTLPRAYTEKNKNMVNSDEASNITWEIV